MVLDLQDTRSTPGLATLIPTSTALPMFTTNPIPTMERSTTVYQPAVEVEALPRVALTGMVEGPDGIPQDPLPAT